MGGPELFPGVDAAVLAAQPFAVQQVRAGQFRAEPGAAEPFDRLPVEVLRRLALADQRAAAGRDAQPPVGSAGLGGFRELIDRAGRELHVPGACGGLDQLRQRPR